VTPEVARALEKAGRERPETGQLPRRSLENVDECIPEGREWDHRWEGESEEDFKMRSQKTRTDWINRFKTVMRKGTPKEKLRFQYYRRLTAEGLRPKMYQKPPPH
jgi:hypothetical protein